jgi:hypothetical protein
MLRALIYFFIFLLANSLIDFHIVLCLIFQLFVAIEFLLFTSTLLLGSLTTTINILFSFLYLVMRCFTSQILQEFAFTLGFINFVPGG